MTCLKRTAARLALAGLDTAILWSWRFGVPFVASLRAELVRQV